MFKVSATARSLACASAMALAFVVAAPVLASAATVNVNVTGARNDNGVIRCGLFNSPNGWPKAGQQFKKAEGKISNGKAVCQFTDVEPGTYAVALFHAEQGERQVEFGLLGIPKQGVAFSRNHSITFGAPSFEKASFPIGQAPASLDIKLIY
ncbi:DUF2141 domain-containing protein [Pseudochelatococcus sp. G4_1912]|uniref:DUF2141 domain-containing protein n=1 Tax=Pseudochelatococcus sp. G4_1912 TaxID=3114288 RepID=UPI0039C71000